jgi:hypothetical protein
LKKYGRLHRLQERHHVNIRDPLSIIVTSINKIRLVPPGSTR